MRTYDIPAQDAATALQAFARQSDLRLLFPYDAAAGRPAPEIRGRLSQAEVLGRLAAAAGLRVTTNDGRVVTLSPAASEQQWTPIGRMEAPPSALPPIVVTGTYIRGVAPVGQNVISIGRREIDSTAAVSMQQLLATAAPQLNGFGSAGQTAGTYEPRLRSLGGSSSASTLVLVDGHRITPGGATATYAPDPNIIPAGAVERVEILPDGASALYGSDAVAGVINIITRKSYNGWQVSVQGGLGDAYSTREADVVYGKAWSRGAVLATYGYSYRSNLFAGDRDFVSGNQSNSGPGATGKGGANFNTYACSPATFVPATGQPGAGLVFEAPYTGAGIVNNSAATGLCSAARLVDLLPSEEAHRVFLSLRQELGDRVRLSGNLTYSNRETISQQSRGSLTNISVFGPGSTPPGGSGQINPFFKSPSGANSGTISFNFNDMFGPGALSVATQETYLGNFTAEVDLGQAWQGSFTATAGSPRFITVGRGTVCQACAFLALNGTTQANGDPQSNVIFSALGASVPVTQFPLTTANALDVWTQGGSATSQAVRNQLLNNTTYLSFSRPITDFVLKFDGPLFSLPAGQVKAALGGEYFIGSGKAATVNSTSLGQTAVAPTATSFELRSRRVTSAFVEVAIPLVGESMNVPLMRGLTVDVAGRIDHYNDIIKGENVTKNPKLGIDWDVTRALSLRASFGTNFTAPQIGHNQFRDSSTIRDYFGTGSVSFTLPQGYPNSAYLGCPAVGACTITAASGKNGIITFGGNPDLAPQKGRTWSAGFDFEPVTFLPGLRASVTYWRASLRGAITNLTNVTQAAATPGLEDVLIINPSAAQIEKYTYGRVQTTPISLPIDFINNTTQSNMFNVWGDGVDFDIGYQFGTPVGEFNLRAVAEVKTKFTKRTASGPVTRALNIANTANTISPMAFAGRGNVGWRKGGARIDLYANYVGDYWLLDGTTPFANQPCPSNVTPTNLGCQHVGDSLIFDTHASYRFNQAGALDDLQVYLDVRNLFDKQTPFINSPDTIAANGSLNTYGNPIGRVVSIGLRKRW